jgi:hypothetical protein
MTDEFEVYLTLDFSMKVQDTSSEWAVARVKEFFLDELSDPKQRSYWMEQIEVREVV